HGGAWQGFETYIARYLGDDLTIVVLANLAGAEPSRFVEAIAGLFDPALEPPEREAIPDREPEVTARLAALLRRTARGELSRDALAHVPAGFFARVADEYRALLKDHDPPQRLELLGTQAARRRSRLSLRHGGRGHEARRDARDCAGRRGVGVRDPPAVTPEPSPRKPAGPCSCPSQAGAAQCPASPACGA